jgi:hypothetical protein
MAAESSLKPSSLAASIIFGFAAPLSWAKLQLMHSIAASNRLKNVPFSLNINITSTLFCKQVLAGFEDKFIGGV